MRSSPSDCNFFKKELKQPCIGFALFFNPVKFMTAIICYEPKKIVWLGENWAVVKSKSGQELFNLLVSSIGRLSVRVNCIKHITTTY